jgi:hypothetical protein
MDQENIDYIPHKTICKVQSFVLTVSWSHKYLSGDTAENREILW